jgi:hypothetical protein
MTITLTPRERAILDNSKVEGANAWLARFVGIVDEKKAREQIDLIVASHAVEYDENKDRADYKTRAERQVVKDADLDARIETGIAAAAQKAVDDEVAFTAKVAAEVTKQLSQ